MQSLLKLVFFVGIQLLAACGSGSQSEISDDARSHNSANTSGRMIHSSLGWQKQIKLYLSANMPDQVAAATENAAKAWNQAVGFEIISFMGYSENAMTQRNLFSTLDDETTTVYYDDQAWAQHTGKPETTLATTVWENDHSSSERILRGDIILNAENYHFIDGDDDKNASLPDEDLVDSESVIIHEMGHLLGLEHVGITKDRDSVMHAKTFIGFGITRRNPSDGDEKLIQSIYTSPRDAE